MARTVTLKGSPLNLVGSEIKVGDTAPDFVAAKNLKESTKLSEFKGKTVIISVVPSLDTPTCDLQGQRFNKEAGTLGDKAAVIVISRDLPPAQARWCGAHDAKNLVLLSDYKDRDFGAKYGAEIKELGVLCRAVFVVNAAGKVVHAEYVPEIADHPNYDAALAAAKKA